jgi:hypothetical protein
MESEFFSRIPHRVFHLPLSVPCGALGLADILAAFPIGPKIDKSIFGKLCDSSTYNCNFFSGGKRTYSSVSLGNGISSF